MAKPLAVIKMNKRQKIFFPFGLITLGILPFLLFYHLSNMLRTKLKPVYCIPIAYPSRDTTSNFTFTVANLRNGRKYQYFRLNSNSYTNDSILVLAKTFLNKIKNEKDTINGICIYVSDSTNYQDFITALDNCNDLFPNISGVDGNYIYSFYQFVDTTNIPFEILSQWRKQYKNI